MLRRPWHRLAAAGVLGLLLSLPFLAAATEAALANADAEDVPLAAAVGGQVVQLGVLTVAAAWVGGRLAPRLGLEAPVLEGRVRPAEGLRRILVPALVVGAVAAAATLALAHLVFLPRLPPAFAATELDIRPAGAFFAVFYGGLTEEVLLRWGVMTALAALLARVGLPRTGALWGGNVGAALLFGAAHLPLAAAIAGGVTPLVVAYVLLANGLAGVVFGWLYQHYGLEAAMMAHAVGDVVLHVLPRLGA